MACGHSGGRCHAFHAAGQCLGRPGTSSTIVPSIRPSDYSAKRQPQTTTAHSQSERVLVVTAHCSGRAALLSRWSPHCVVEPSFGDLMRRTDTNTSARTVTWQPCIAPSNRLGARKESHHRAELCYHGTTCVRTVRKLRGRVGTDPLYIRRVCVCMATGTAGAFTVLVQRGY